jgi:hypothetical protein
MKIEANAYNTSGGFSSNFGRLSTIVATVDKIIKKIIVIDIPYALRILNMFMKQNDRKLRTNLDESGLLNVSNILSFQY